MNCVSTSDGAPEVEQVTQLLAAHAHLIRETSEQLVSNVSQAIETLQDEVADALDGHDMQAEIVKRISGLYAHLQLEDIVRQQVSVLDTGLKALSDLQPAHGKGAPAWLDEAVEQIMASYVMRSQYQLHAARMGGEDRGFSDDHEEAAFF
ncbi:MAG: hypothetical protein AAF231_11230 [Pseudomonadota bacterium]